MIVATALEIVPKRTDDQVSPTTNPIMKNMKSTDESPPIPYDITMNRSSNDPVKTPIPRLTSSRTRSQRLSVIIVVHPFVLNKVIAFFPASTKLKPYNPTNINAHLLKYSTNDSMIPRQQSARHTRIPSSLSRALRTTSRAASNNATMRLPRQIEPKEYVVARKKESRVAGEQHEPASAGANHQVPTTPAIVTLPLQKISGHKMY